MSTLYRIFEIFALTSSHGLTVVTLSLSKCSLQVMGIVSQANAIQCMNYKFSFLILSLELAKQKQSDVQMIALQKPPV